MTRYAIGLGSNVGDRYGHLVSACHAIGEGVDNWQVSSLYETEPVGGPDQDPFLNAVTVVESGLTPEAMLGWLHSLEDANGRVRHERWGPRTLDLDLLVSDGAVVSTEHLTLPHPRAAEREFVLRPLVEVWPDAPVTEGASAAEALAALPDQGVDRLTADWMPPLSPLPGRLAVAAQFVLLVLIAIVIVVTGDLPAVPGPWMIGGIVISIAGVALGLVAARQLGASLTPNPVPREGAGLVSAGLYGRARHPIYGGVILLFVGLAFLMGSLWGLLGVVVLIAFFWIKSSYEERQLRMRHSGYRAYRQKVPHRFIPFLI